MNIQAEKLEIMKLILETDNPSILESIRKLFKKESTVDFWETLPQEQREDIINRQYFKQPQKKRCFFSQHGRYCRRLRELYTKTQSGCKGK